MGDRSNLVAKQGTTRIYMYSHWRGPDAAVVLRDCIKAGKRLDDASYFARIVFCALIGKHNWDAETGYGLSTEITDNEYSVLVFDCGAQKVWSETEGGVPIPKRQWTFAEFAALDDSAAAAAMER